MGIQYLHTHNISNRDIKVDNILCKTTTIKGQDIKIADFTTVRYSEDDISYFTCGTPGFRSPEVQAAGSEVYSCKAMDIWSFGISMYTYYF
jgi:[calcium/calmodulin-dependent protein kinase] kinase